MRFARYVAIGDSQTEGLLDPDGRGGYRGWADRLAEILAIENPHVAYGNLAVRGRRMAAIRNEQLAPALEQSPDLVTVMGGLNDVLRRDFDADRVLADLEAMVDAFRRTGATVVTNTFPAIEQIAPLLRRLAPRVRTVNEGIRDLAQRHGALLVDFAERGVGTDLRIWSGDRIHANSFGHSLIAAAFADTLGIPGHQGWDEPLPPMDTPRRWRDEAHWLGTSVMPWLLRRARGRSSGDGIRPKRPRALPVASLFHLVDPADWPAGGWYQPPSLTTEGFVHLSFADQLAGSANRHLVEAGELVAVEVDPGAVGAEIRIDNGFPHVYGALPVSAAVAVHPMRRDASGAWLPLSPPTADRPRPTSPPG